MQNSEQYSSNKISLRTGDTIVFRPERQEDYEDLLKLTYEAFLTLDYPGRRRIDEHFLIHLLRGSKSVIPDLLFVAELNGAIVGHILYTNSVVKMESDEELQTITFGPLTVHPKYQKEGIGAALTKYSMDIAKNLGYEAVVIEGVPAYYPKLGFKRAREFGLELEDGTSPDSLMAFELNPGYLHEGGTVYFLAPEYVSCEEDDEGFVKFHREFMKNNYPGQITLRPFWDADISLMERWLYEPHVSKWYKYPEHWLNEVNERDGKFSFITHFIAEYEGTPMGFCQYYDCFFAQEHEVWNDEWRVGDKQGETYSIDYLIGEPEYLKKGHGREIVRLVTEKAKEAGAKRIIVEPEKENAASNHVLLANGYEYNGEDYLLELENYEKVTI